MNKPTSRSICTGLILLAMAGCTDLKPLEADISNLKAQVTRLQSDLQGSKQATDQASRSAESAAQAAAGAQSTANQAIAAVQASQACCDSTNEKIDRMFKRSLQK